MSVRSSAYIAILLVTLQWLTIGAFPSSCPKEKDLFPCTCKELAYGLHVFCVNFNDSTSLQRSFRALRDYTVHKILIHGVYLSSPAPADLFVGMDIRFMRIEKSRLLFDQPAFTDLESSLKGLSMDNTNLFDLATLYKLTELDVQHNKITEVKDGWLGIRVPNLHILILDHDQISRVGEKAFAEMKELRRISLSGNKITKISRSMFPEPAYLLKRLDFSFNDLYSLPTDIFVDMPSLREVVFSYNHFKTLPEQTWMNIWNQVKMIILYGMDFDCDEKMNWIRDFKSPERLEGVCINPVTVRGMSLENRYYGD